MPDENPTPADRWDERERDVIYLLTGDESPIWSVEDIGRTLEHPGSAEDIVRRLRAEGLIHQTSDGHVFATRAAFRMVQMIGQVV
jgi:Mn-dependent DtxR family transcriptional regulator